MTKDQALDLLMLLSAMESWSFSAGQRLPDYLAEDLSEGIAVLRNVVTGKVE